VLKEGEDKIFDREASPTGGPIASHRIASQTRLLAVRPSLPLPCHPRLLSISSSSARRPASPPPPPPGEVRAEVSFPILLPPFCSSLTFICAGSIDPCARTGPGGDWDMEIFHPNMGYIGRGIFISLIGGDKGGGVLTTDNT
jgi:hypothetical protein